jgi:pyruvate kinase
MRKTKIICTVGPATDEDGVLEKMIKAGMNVARFNFSHGTHEMHKKRFNELVALRDKLDLPIATMLDTKGPEIRIGYFKDHKAVTLKEGDDYILTSRDIECDEKQASVSFKELPQDVRMGTIIRINDGLVSLRVEKVEGPDIYCKVVDGGVISDQKGVNVPDTNLSMPYLSEHDMSDLAFGAKLGFDFIAASFIRSAADVDYLRNFTNSVGFHKVKIIAKIENMSGVNNIDEIIAAADGIMIARGDMGVEIPFELIPSIQKKLIKKAYTAGKQVITATQMLESMITNARPTRAEITDVANAIYDGTSAIMLSGETAAGKHPVEAVETMALIAETTEADIDYLTKFKNDSSDYDNSITNAISHATVTTAHDLGAKAIITVTKSGSTARMISKHRPSSMIISCTTDETVCRQMNMSWGMIPLMCEEKNNSDALFSHAVEVARKHGLISKGDIVVITAGIPLGISGTTNMLKVERIK